MAITKNQSGTYAAVDIHYNRPACAPHQNVINYLDHLHIMVIHKSLTAYLGCGYSSVLVGPLGNDEMSDFLSVTIILHQMIFHIMILYLTQHFFLI